jgi:hypothetical protein
LTQRQQWIDALIYHRREIEKLSLVVRELDEGAARAAEASAELARRQIEYNRAQMIRHQISLALVSSRLDS